jgi:formyl transferase-like protein
MLTAGFDRAPAVLALVELLRRDRHTIEGVVVVSPYRLARLRTELRRRGLGFVRQAALRLLGRRATRAPGPLDRLLTELGIEPRSLRRICRARGVSYRSVPSLSHEPLLAWLREAAPDWVIYGGGGILRRPFLEAAGRRVLNAHSGPLPEIRGMNACEWSLLLDLPLTTTVHLIDEGIDTGPILERVPVPIETSDTLDAVRERCVVVGVHALVRAVARPPAAPTRLPGADRHRQCYVLAPALRELAEGALARRVASAAK